MPEIRTRKELLARLARLRTGVIEASTVEALRAKVYELIEVFENLVVEGPE